MLFKQDLKRPDNKAQIITKYSIKFHWVSLKYAHQNSYFVVVTTQLIFTSTVCTNGIQVCLYNKLFP